jgi:hypothetical protein
MAASVGRCTIVPLPPMIGKSVMQPPARANQKPNFVANQRQTDPSVTKLTSNRVFRGALHVGIIAVIRRLSYPSNRDFDARNSLMRASRLVRWATFVVAAVGAGAVAAATVEVTFPEYSGAELNAGVFPATSVIVGQKTPLGLPAGEAVVSGTISGSWGNAGAPGKGTAGVDLYLDGLLVAQCLPTDATCYCPDSAACTGAVPWSRTLTSAQVAALNASGATLTATQTSPIVIRLGATQLTLTTAPVVPPVPTLSPPALVVLLLGMATMGLLAARRRRTARR